jgi:LAO/AO transport system kinase
MASLRGMEAVELVDRLLAGDRRALARVLTRVEDGSTDRLREVVRLLHPHTGRARLVGVTGSPGVGKSTLTSALIAHWRSAGRTVGVLAVDPSSPFTGGALLGDRVRMQDHVLDQGVFVRSMASRGHLGGLSWATPQALLVLDAAGFDVVLVETVGVGQAEVEIASLADTTVVTLAPGMGDAIQAAKAGILEVADVFCVNKADRDGADRTVRELRDMQALGHGDWLPPIRTTVASAGTGVAELAEAIDRHRGWLEESGELAARRQARARSQVRDVAVEAVRSALARLEDGDLLARLARRVAARELDPYAAADDLLVTLEGRGIVAAERPGGG